MFESLAAMLKSFFALLTTLLLTISGIGGIGSSAGKAEVKNVIMLIGDGMGENHLEWTKAEKDVSLVMDTLPMRGYSETASFFGTVTDSAAGATALSTGITAINNTLSVYPTDVLAAVSYPMTITELAMEKGMKTGIVTSDLTSGATPAAFSSHTSLRSNEKPITTQQLSSGIDLIWGAPTSSATISAVGKSEYTLVKSADDIDALGKDEKSFGQFGGDIWAQVNDSGSTLSELTVKALELLDNENGFFLMIEGAHIDKNSHDNKAEDMMDALLEFDRAVGIALDFAKADGETIVIVTADHETGAIKYEGGTYRFTSGDHSGVNVPLRVYGCESFVGDGKAIKNRTIPVLIADKLGCDKNEFPREIYTNSGNVSAASADMLDDAA